MERIPTWKGFLHGKDSYMEIIPTWKGFLHGKDSYMERIPTWKGFVYIERIRIYIFYNPQSSQYGKVHT